MSFLFTITQAQYDADLAAEREAGAAEVRARVTAALDAVDDQDGLEGVWEVLALNGGE